MYGCYRINCFRCQVYRGDVSKRYSLSHCNVSFRNNRANNRHTNDRKLPRRTQTLKAMSSNERCPFFFIINFYANGFHVMTGRGNPIHQNHTNCLKRKEFVLHDLFKNPRDS